MINLIWAMDINWLIGVNNKLPWRYPEDLAYFREKTASKTVLMGQNTYESLLFYYKKRPLPFKKIYVASLNKTNYHEAISIVADVDLFLRNYQGQLWVIGGKTIYNLALPYAKYLYITWILKPYVGDTYFNKFDLTKDFVLKSEQKGESKDLLFSVYKRK